MPTLVLGGGVAVVAVMANQLLLFFLAEYMILSGGGDFLIILKSMLYHIDTKERLEPRMNHLVVGGDEPIHSILK